MKETEITVQVFATLEAIDLTLAKQGFKKQQVITVIDSYYSKYTLAELQAMTYPALIKNSILVREIMQDYPFYQIVYKQKEYDQEGHVIAEEKVATAVADLKKICAIFELAGLTKWSNLINHSTVYQKDAVELVIQNVKGLGIFLEFEENETLKDLTPKAKIERMKAIIKTLDLPLGNDFSCKKVYLKFKQ